MYPNGQERSDIEGQSGRRDGRYQVVSVVCPAKGSVGKSVKHATWPWRVASSKYDGSRLEGDLPDCRGSATGAVAPIPRRCPPDAPGTPRNTQGDAEGDGRIRLQVWEFSAGRTLMIAAFMRKMESAPPQGFDKSAASEGSELAIKLEQFGLVVQV
jgi:hypothetical protein